MLFTKNPHPLNLLQGASPPSRLTPWYILQGRIPGMSLELKYIIIYSSNVYVFLQELIPLFLPKPRYDLFYFIIMYVALLGIYFMNTVPYFILLCVASLGIYLLIPVTSLEIKNIYYIVCTSALMFFTHTEFRMTKQIVSRTVIFWILNKSYLERSFFGSYDKSQQKKIKNVS